MRLRQETAKKLRALGAKRKAEKAEAENDSVTVKPTNAAAAKDGPSSTEHKQAAVEPVVLKSRAPKVKTTKLARPPTLKAKFRKRQKHKSWLPTHMFHAKRARMSPPSAPLWRFAVPLTPTAKSYRPTHRASTDRGAVAWDVSYMATIALAGQERSVVGMLKALGIGARDGKDDVWSRKGDKRRAGLRVLQSFAFQREAPHSLIAPVTLVWCASELQPESGPAVEPDKRKRKLFLRVHPSAFFQLWAEVLRVAKVAKPEVSVEDLRFEVGSIDITGPGATEALLAALWPTPKSNTIGPGHDERTVGDTWSALAGLTNPALLPTNALIGLNVQDPRLHHPPRSVRISGTETEQNDLLQLLAKWAVDKAQGPPDLFDRRKRLAAQRQLASQKSINRRKALAPPGQYPAVVPDKDPRVPVLLYTSTMAPCFNHKQGQASWTLLLPWKCVQPVWYSLMYYPLSTGQQARFGGLDEMRQICFERGEPWFPADYPGTDGGWEWEVQERKKRLDEHLRRPKGKRTAWEKVELGEGRKGEVGRGWACDWEALTNVVPSETAGIDGEGVVAVLRTDADASAQQAVCIPTTPAKPGLPREELTAQKPAKLRHLPSPQAMMMLDRAQPAERDADVCASLMTVRLTLLTRGVPQTCARIYRLPSSTTNGALRKAWIGLQPNTHAQDKRGRKGPKHGLPCLPKGASDHEIQRRLAQSLLQPPRAGQDDWPACPGEEDLVGFVTSGNFNLAEGQGTGIGSILVQRVLDDVKRDGKEGRLCVVRNAGQSVGRLARWDIV